MNNISTRRIRNDTDDSIEESGKCGITKYSLKAKGAWKLRDIYQTK